MDDSVKKKCFDYFSGIIDEASAASIRSFLAKDKSKRDLYADWEKEWSKTNTPTFAQINAFSLINSRIRRHRRNRILHYATGFAVAVCAVLSVFIWGPDLILPSQKEERICVVETGYREKTKITLPDSTQVWLNSASKISYPSDFAESERVVKLEGEAFFDVVKNPRRPFIVMFGDCRIKVLGTKFNVSAYSSENLYQAALIEGSIEFLTSGAMVEMHPSEVLTYDVLNDEMNKTKTDASKYSSWINNKLEYQNITLDKLVQRLSSIYGVQINCKQGNYLSQPFGVMLDLRESLPNILDGLTLIMPVKWINCIDGSILIKETENKS